MLSFDPKANTERENYKLLIGTIIPRPIAFVTSKAEDGTINGAPFSYFNIVSSKPPMISLAIQRKEGHMKDIARNILRQNEFVVHVVDEANVEAINLTAASLPPDESEIEKANLTLVSSKKISVPGIKEAKVRLECRLEHALELGGDGEISTDFIIGRVVHFSIDKDIYDEGKINQSKLLPVSRLAGSSYAKIGETFSLERPK